MAKSYSSLRNGSDIRGVAIAGVPGEELSLTAEAVYDLACGFASWLSEKYSKDPSELRVSVGRDSRLSGPELMESFISGLIACGVHAYDCGMATTPAMFMSCVFDDFAADGAVMVTASHLPCNRNGLKFFSAQGGLEGSDVAAICELADNLTAQVQTPDPEGVGSVEQRDLLSAYAAHLRSIITGELGSDAPLTGLSIAVDAGNGAAGFYATEVLAPLGANVSASQFLEPDGSFPHHIPNPENEEAMEAICSTVRKNSCDLGLIFDTDVDRSSAVDEQAREINRNGIVALAAVLAADGHPGSAVVTDSITSDELGKFLTHELGLTHVRYMRGYRNVINKMIELNEEGIDCQLAIETSGHAAFAENYSLDDGAYLATRIVIAAARLKGQGKGISSLVAGLAEPAESREVRMNLVVDDFQVAGDEIIEQVRTWAASDEAREAALRTCGANETITLVEPNYEGVRVAFSGPVDGWFLLRKSLHDPLMPLNIESRREGGLECISSCLRELLAEESRLDSSKL